MPSETSETGRIDEGNGVGIVQGESLESILILFEKKWSIGPQHGSHKDTHTRTSRANDEDNSQTKGELVLHSTHVQ